MRTREFAKELEESFRDKPSMLSIEQAAELVSVSPRTVRYWLASGELRHVKLSQGRAGRVRIPKAALLSFLAERAA